MVTKIPGKAILPRLIKPRETKYVDINHRVFKKRINTFSSKSQNTIFHQINIKKPNINKPENN